MSAPVEFDGDRENIIVTDDSYTVHIAEIYYSFLGAGNYSVLIKIEIDGKRSRALDDDFWFFSIIAVIRSSFDGIEPGAFEIDFQLTGDVLSLKIVFGIAKLSHGKSDYYCHNSKNDQNFY